MAVQITRQDVDTAAEMAGLNPGEDCVIRPAYRDGSAAVAMPSGQMVEFMAALSIVLAGQNRVGAAMTVAKATQTDAMGLGIILYWPGVEIAG